MGHGAPAPVQTQKPSWGARAAGATRHIMKGAGLQMMLLLACWSRPSASKNMMTGASTRRPAPAPSTAGRHRPIPSWWRACGSGWTSSCLSQRDFDGFNQRRGTPGLDHHADGTSSLMMEVNGIQHRIDFDFVRGHGRGGRGGVRLILPRRADVRVFNRALPPGLRRGRGPQGAPSCPGGSTYSVCET